MRKRLLIGLLSGALALTLALPGAAVAKEKEKDKDVCKKGHWAQWERADDSAFADQGECVSYVAEGGTLKAPAFLAVCSAWGGSVVANMPPRCEFDGTPVVGLGGWNTMFEEVFDVCVSLGYPVTQGYYYADPQWIRCNYYGAG